MGIIPDLLGVSVGLSPTFSFLQVLWDPGRKQYHDLDHHRTRAYSFQDRQILKIKSEPVRLGKPRVLWTRSNTIQIGYDGSGICSRHFWIPWFRPGWESVLYIWPFIRDTQVGGSLCFTLSLKTGSADWISSWHQFSHDQSMEPSAGRGDQGIIKAMITRPKPQDGDMSGQQGKELALLGPSSKDSTLRASSTDEETLKLKAKEVGEMSPPPTCNSRSGYLGPEEFTEGEVLEDDEDAVEVDIEEEEMKQVGQLTVLARFYSLRTPNLSALFEDMGRAWRLRSDMSYKSLRDNLFIITFGAEGDYNFVLQGGRWLHKGDALLVAAFDGLTCPSKIPLEVVPIWIRIYDLPLVLMTKARGELYGSKFGQVREVDVEADGRNRHDFFRIRVDLLVKKPLKSKIAIKNKVQGNEVTRRFDVRYERVPYFCFICGFIGHSDRDCVKKVANNDAPIQYSAELRCSPLKPFEKKVSTVKGTEASTASHRLSFRKAGSASSSSSRRYQGEQWDEAVPPRVDTHYGFDAQEKVGDETLDEQLASQTDKLHVSDEKG